MTNRRVYQLLSVACCLLQWAVSCSRQLHSAEFFVRDVFVAQGTEHVDVPILAIPDDAVRERVSAMNISFAVGEPGQMIPIVESGQEWDQTCWLHSVAGLEDADPTRPKGPAYIGVMLAGKHRARAAVCMLNPTKTRPIGIVITFRVVTKDLPPGTYLLNPNAMEPEGVDGGSAADTRAIWRPGFLTITEPQVNE